MANIPRSSGVFSLGALSGDGAGVSSPWTPADITSATVVGWFDGENVKGGTSGNSGATQWVNQISGQNNLSFNSSPTVGTDNVRTVSGSYLLETGTAAFQQTADFRVFVAATLQGGSGSSAYYPLISTVSGTPDYGAFIFWKGSNTFASYPNYNTGVNNWGNFDNHTPSHRSNFASNPGVFDFTASQSSPWQVSFDGGSNTRSASTTYTNQIAPGLSLCFGYMYFNSRRCDAEYNQIVIIHGTLSSGDEEKLYGYLAHKAGSASNLPSSNSYQSAAPTKTTAGATRPARRWGGMTGRSLVETTTGAAPLWTPDDVTNTAAPAIWLDASTSLTTNKGSLSTTVTLGSGAWSSSGTQNGLTTAINSAAGTVEPITFTGTAVASVAMLYRWDSAGAARSYATTFSGSTAADYTFMGGYGSAVLHTYGSADSHNWDHVREDGVEYSTSHTTAAAWSTRTTDWMLHVFVLNGTRTATINRWGYERTNAGRHFTGELAEVMAFPGKLSQSECEQVEGYLAHKWGLASLLPSAHSYKSAAPTSGTGSPSTNVPTTGVLSLPELLQARYGLGASVSIDVLVVGGGSGQGGHNDNNYYVAGGNAGDVTRRTAYAVTLGSPIAITIGAGSASGADGQNVATDSAQGGQTAFGSLTADGGHGSPGDLSQATSVTYDNTTTIDIDGTVTNYSMGAWASGTNAVGGSGAGGDGSGTAGSSSGGAGYTYQVNSTTVDTVSQGGDWLTTQTGTNHAATEYGSGGQGGYDSEAVGIDGVVYAAYPTGTVNSYTWSGAAGDINKDTSTVSGYTILRFTGNGDWTPSAVAVSLSADVLVVGGGAGGAEADISVTVGNGGSGGAVTLASAYDLGTSAITISVGAGGTAPQDSNYNDPGGAGGQSAFGVITAAGAPQNVMFSTATSQQTSFTNYGGSTTTYTTTESGAGTQSAVPYDGLNGAGAGGNATTTAGGNGYLWSVTNTRYGAGGGAARFNNSTRYVGGSGGGGSGGYSSGASYYAATAATGYGSGGGGGYLTGYPSDGTAGVVLVYLSGTTYTLSEAQAAFTGSNSDVAVSTPAGGGTLITFTGNGDWTPPTA